MIGNVESQMYRVTTTLSIAAAFAAGIAGAAAAQEDAPAGSLTGIVAEDGTTTPISDNVKVFPVTENAESCVYDPDREMILAMNRGAAPKDKLNDGFVSFVDQAGTVATERWTGESGEAPLLNQPYGSAIAGGTLYVADRNGGTSKSDPTRAVLRMYDLATGAVKGEVEVDSPGLNDIAVAADGTIFATQTSAGGKKNGPDTWKVFRVTPAGEVSVLIEGEPLNQPNGIEMDGDGNIVVVNLGDAGVLTFSPEGELVKTEEAAQPGSDGLVIMPDGTKYVNSLRQGGVTRIAPDGTTELIAKGIPGSASMCFHSGSNQLVIPMGQNNALAFVPLD